MIELVCKIDYTLIAILYDNYLQQEIFNDDDEIDQYIKDIIGDNIVKEDDDSNQIQVYIRDEKQKVPYQELLKSIQEYIIKYKIQFDKPTTIIAYIKFILEVWYIEQTLKMRFKDIE